jgi:hypothetical protein
VHVVGVADQLVFTGLQRLELGGWMAGVRPAADVCRSIADQAAASLFVAFDAPKNSVSTGAMSSAA